MEKFIKGFFEKITNKIEEYKFIQSEEKRRKQLEEIKKMQKEKTSVEKKLKLEEILKLEEKMKELRE